MKFQRFKLLFLCSLPLIVFFFLFAPGKAQAGTFASVKVEAYERRSTNTVKKNVAVRIDSTKNNSYKFTGYKRGVSIGCRGCGSESAILNWNEGVRRGYWQQYTGRDGVATFGDTENSGFACGQSDCGSGDLGTCNPFKVSAMGDWPSGSYWRIIFYVNGVKYDDGRHYTGTNPGRSVKLTNGGLVLARLYYYPPPPTDSLSATLTANPNSLAFTEPEKTATPPVKKQVDFTANVNHSATPTHGISKYEWDFNYKDENGDGKVDASDFTSDRTTTTNITTYGGSGDPGGGYAWPGGTNPTVTAAVRVTCAGGLVRIARTVITFDVGGHEIVCRDLTAEPQQGTVPLTINFAADIIDSLGHAITQYEWDFDWDGAESNFTLDRATAVNRTTFTFDEEAENRRIGVRGTTGEAGLSTVSCPVSVNIDAVNWSESNEIEIAP